MPSLAVNQPAYPRRLDSRDSVDPADRQLESAFASLALCQGAIAGLRNPINAVSIGVSGVLTNTSADFQTGKYFMPSTITSANRTTYETAVNNLLVAFGTAYANFAAIQALKPVPNQG